MIGATMRRGTQALAIALLVSAAPARADIDGQIVDATGVPIIGARVSVRGGATTTTDGGSLVIDGSPSSITAPAGGTATFFGGGGVFGFNFTSYRDLKVGADLLDTPSFGPNAPTEEGNFTIDRIEVRSHQLLAD